MIRVFLADGRRIHLNPAAIAYMEQLPDPPQGSDDKNQPKTKIVLMTGESLSVRQGTHQILVQAGEPVPARRKTEETGADGSEE